MRQLNPGNNISCPRTSLFYMSIERSNRGNVIDREKIKNDDVTIIIAISISMKIAPHDDERYRYLLQY